MPDATGKLYLSDYVAELKARGFDGFSDADLTSYVNRGYYHVARKSRWYWEETFDTFDVAVGELGVTTWPVVGGQLPNLKTLSGVYVTNAGLNRKLRPMSKDKFFQVFNDDLWLPKNRGEPTEYYWFRNFLYVLPPPKAARSFRAEYHQQTSPMVLTTDQPLTPLQFDEAIMLAALMRCHQRANEPIQSAAAELELREFFDDALDEEFDRLEEQPDRVKPDNTWL